MNIVSIGADSHSEYNSDNWQRVIPARALVRAGHTVYMPLVDRWFKHDDEIRSQLARADIVVVQRVLVEESRERCKYWRERKKPILSSFDDHYALLRPGDGNQASKFWFDGEVDVHHPMGVTYTKKLDIHPMQQVKMASEYLSGFSMPSRVLADYWKWLLPCYYIPNFIDSPRYLSAKKNKAWKKTGGELVIGWGGSLSHLNSFKFSGILDGLNRVFKKRKNVKFLLAGDERIVPLLKLPKDRIIFQPYVMWSDWPRVISKMDIMVAPLFGEYDWGRSAIKSTESCLMGLPFVATGCPTYQDWMDNKVGLYVDDGPKEEIGKRATEWEEKLLDVIDHYSEYRDEMASHIEYAMSWDVDANVGYIENVYREVIEKNGR